jgi:small basic protein (TIGR04137 family)
MSLDRSLKSANSLVRHRNVLTRDERLAKLKELEKWDDKRSIFGLPKVSHRKMVVGGKGGAKDEAAGDAAAAPAAAAPAKGAAAKGAAAPAKGAAPAKAAAPAKGAAAAAPAKGKK